MPSTWRDDHHTAFLTERVPAYHQSGRNLTRKQFWEDTAKAWFERFPLDEPSAQLIAEAGTKEKAMERARQSKIKQIKRFFRKKSDGDATGQLNLRLNESLPRKRSEVQEYMTLYYDSRIRKTVLERWKKERIPLLEANLPMEIPEDEVDPSESAIFKDMKIPISFKNEVAQSLWENEDEAIKNYVRSKRNGDVVTKTVYNTEGEERLELLRQYVKNTSSLHKNMTNVLRNIEEKCAGKGIMWIACPSPTAEGRPIGYFQCIGEAPGSKDFEEFIGAEKAKEFKGLFASWIGKVYPFSECDMFNLNQNISSTGSTGSVGSSDLTGSCNSSANDDDGNEGDSGGDSPPGTLLPQVSEPLQAITAVTGHNLMPTADATLTEPRLAQDSDALEMLGQFVQPNVLAMLDDQRPDSIDIPRHSDLPPLPNGTSTKPSQNELVPSTGIGHATIVSVVHTEAPPTELSDTHPQPTTINPSLLLAPAPEVLQAGGSDPIQSSVLKVDSPTLFDIPENASQSEWMEKKGTLDYFRSVSKRGNLSVLISNWYRLEKALGFPKRTRKFPMKTRPGVIHDFYKNGHCYRRNYALDSAHSLGRSILTWWDEISEVGHVRFGGPCGIYTLVVLTTWWCCLLAGKPKSECADYLSFVQQFNHAILESISPSGQSGASTLPINNSFTSPPPPSQYVSHLMKRAHPGEPSEVARKRSKV